MQRLIGAVTRRLDPAAQEQITVRQVGSDRIEVIIPGADREVVEQKEADDPAGNSRVRHPGQHAKHREIIRQAQASPDPVLRREGQVIAAWREVGWIEQNKVRTQKPVYADQASETVQREVERNGHKVREILVVYEPPKRRVTGQYLTRAIRPSTAREVSASAFRSTRPGRPSSAV